MNERYPRKLVVENLKDNNTRKSTRPNNLATTSQTTARINPAKGKYGIDVGSWITWAINEGIISISGADTHSFNTNLATSGHRTHTVTGSAWRMISPNFDMQFRFDTDDDDLFMINTAGSVAMGDPYGDGNGTVIYVDDILKSIDVRSDDGNIDIGDSNGFGNGAKVTVNNATTAAATTTITPRLNIAPITVAVAATLTPAEGDIIMVSDTDATFTSIGLWGYVNGAWAAMT